MDYAYSFYCFHFFSSFSSLPPPPPFPPPHPHPLQPSIFRSPTEQEQPPITVQQVRQWLFKYVLWYAVPFSLSFLSLPQAEQQPHAKPAIFPAQEKEDTLTTLLPELAGDLNQPGMPTMMPTQPTPMQQPMQVS